MPDPVAFVQPRSIDATLRRSSGYVKIVDADAVLDARDRLAAGGQHA